MCSRETQRHKRMTLVNAVRYAIEQGGLCGDPLATVNWRIAKTIPRVDPRVVANSAEKWTDTGKLHDERGLKSRPPGDTRPVPLPPRLVALWRDSLETFGTADDGRLFFNEHGGIVGSSTYDGVWRETRELARPPDLVRSPLAACAYDLRHSALSTWLNAGVDPTEVAERAGNSVEVLLTRYAKCLYGRAAIANQRIQALLDEYG